ncbi:DUF761 domain protein [Senna tora]|uniref:DUF761 domain protein n=1 Tax=Senna tora TaxID=362788 RepID=A0A834SDQ3_9FABA|nr:DUF761 domain protein [Senna tora]
MKNGASGLVKHILGGLSSKANAIKARLIIFSLLKTNKKFLITSISHKIHSLLGRHHHHHTNEECFLEDANNCIDHHQSKAIVVYNSYEVVPNFGGDDDDGKYPDLTHSLFESEGVAEEFGGSVIDMVKNSKEEAGEEFKLEDEIDHVADLFIRKFRRQIVLQKQESLKRIQEMLHRGPEPALRSKASKKGGPEPPLSSESSSE